MKRLNTKRKIRKSRKNSFLRTRPVRNNTDFVFPHTEVVKVSGMNMNKTQRGGGEFIIPYGVTKITSRYFINYEPEDEDTFETEIEEITSVTIPDSVKIIGTKAFTDFKNLVSITIPDTVTRIENSAFECCLRLRNITIPDSVTRIGKRAFYGCINLKSITIPKSVTKIENETFAHCKSLTEIRIPDSVTYIGNEAFLECNHLATIHIPISVNYIGDYAFENTSLVSFEIPNPTAYIGKDIFLKNKNKNMEIIQTRLVELNTLLQSKCPQYVIEYIFDDDEDDYDYINIDKLLIKYFLSNNDKKTISEIKIDRKRSLITIESSTNELYRNRKLNTLTRAITFVLFEGIVEFLHSDAVNPISLWLLNKYKGVIIEPIPEYKTFDGLKQKFVKSTIHVPINEENVKIAKKVINEFVCTPTENLLIEQIQKMNNEPPEQKTIKKKHKIRCGKLFCTVSGGKRKTKKLVK